jgi:monoamine oxidase
LDIVVIGAGLSGLTAAATLCNSGAKVQVFEAGTHIGGRIRALRDPVSQHALADLGPTWVWPKYQPIAARWLEELGLSTFEQFNEGDAVILGYGPAPVRQPLPGQDGMVRIVGGPTALIEASPTELAMPTFGQRLRLLEFLKLEKNKSPFSLVQVRSSRRIR